MAVMFTTWKFKNEKGAAVTAELKLGDDVAATVIVPKDGTVTLTFAPKTPEDKTMATVTVGNKAGAAKSDPGMFLKAVNSDIDGDGNVTASVADQGKDLKSPQRA